MLVDSFNRELTYLRVSLTDKCNLRCRYCMPPDGIPLLDHDQVLRNEEFIYFIHLFASMGIRKVRFTGGEPLVRRGFVDIISEVRKRLPHLEICITTNGVLLEKHLSELKLHRVNKLNISLDTLSPSLYRELTGMDYHARVLNSIRGAIDAGVFDVKINAVIQEHTIGELGSFIDYFKDHDVSLRFIERMPVGEIPEMGEDPFISSDLLLDALSSLGTLTQSNRKDTSVAHMYDFHPSGTGRKMKIGMIPAISHKFCSSCNRLRLTCDGALRACLHGNSEYDLKALYRMDAAEKDIRELIMEAVRNKQKEHCLDCYSDTSTGCRAVTSSRNMSRIGG